MRKVVSIALFGPSTGYESYLSTFVLAHNNLFPREDGWSLYLATDDQLSDSTKKLIARLYSSQLVDQFTVHARAPLCKAMLWRVDPVFWPGKQDGLPNDVEFVFCRDIDSIPMPRDLACCSEFIRVSEARRLGTHTIHDSEYHIGIMGGLCGFNTKILREVTGWSSLADLCAASGYTDEQWAHKGADQLALNKLLLRASGPPLFEHRFAGWHGGPGVKPARGAGQYACAGVSSPVPDAGSGRFIDGHYLNDRADHLGKHLGCAGYNIDEARRFWFEYGDPKVTAMVKACEAP